MLKIGLLLYHDKITLYFQLKFTFQLDPIYHSDVLFGRIKAVFRLKHPSPKLAWWGIP